VHGSRGATLALRDGERGLIVKCFADCDPGDIFAELRRRGLVAGPRHGGDGLRPDAEAIRRGRKAEETERRRRIEDARRHWEAAQDARGSPAVCYLAGRGIIIPPPPSLRWEPRCWHREARGELPAMVARVDGLAGGIIGIHRTWLDRNDRGQWRRRNRASLGLIAGGAVRLAPAAEMLLIAEGIETTLAGMVATRLPGWAALSTSGLVALRLPPIVRTVIILADHDRSGAGERAARSAAARWLAEGRRVRIAMPPEPGTDIADVLAARAYTGIAEVRDAAA
jgi:hypothetical protein